MAQSPTLRAYGKSDVGRSTGSPTAAPHAAGRRRGSDSFRPIGDVRTPAGRGMKAGQLVPFAWKDRPALIEVAFPAQKISVEAQCERKAGAGQTLTALGSYWKGR